MSILDHDAFKTWATEVDSLEQRVISAEAERDAVKAELATAQSALNAIRELVAPQKMNEAIAEETVRGSSEEPPRAHNVSDLIAHPPSFAEVQAHKNLILQRELISGLDSAAPDPISVKSLLAEASGSCGWIDDYNAISFLDDLVTRYHGLIVKSGNGYCATRHLAPRDEDGHTDDDIGVIHTDWHAILDEAYATMREPVEEKSQVAAPGKGLGDLASAISAITGKPVDFASSPQRKRRRMARERTDTTVVSSAPAPKITIVGRLDDGALHNQTWEFNGDKITIVASNDGGMGTIHTYEREDVALPPIIPLMLDRIAGAKTPEVVISHDSGAILFGLTREFQTVLQLHRSAEGWGYSLKNQSVRVRMLKDIMTGPFAELIEQQDHPLAWRVR